MINRPSYMKRLSKAMKRSPITALLGPRQCGKTTLAHALEKEEKVTFFDLESQPDRTRLQNPQLMLGALKGLVILDEVQEMPELFPVLRVLVDRPENKTRFLVLGSASPDIVKRTSETLAGRVEYVDLAGFDLWETGETSSDALWLRGGFPRSFLAETDEDSMAWRENFIRTFLERDIPHLGITIPPVAMRRFWMMLAHYHGQVWNASEVGRSMGLTDKTVRSYLDILSGTFMVRQLQPWHENIGKRQVKAPKIYLRDSGLLHGLFGLADIHGLLGYPRVGASWEGFALEQVMQVIGQPEAFFWATHSGAEIDLMFFRQGRKFGIEFKFSEAPKITRSAQTALETLNLEHLWIVYPGEHQYPFSDRISVLPLKDVAKVVQHTV
jgi:uncharacterized protein